MCIPSASLPNGVVAEDISHVKALTRLAWPCKAFLSMGYLRCTAECHVRTFWQTKTSSGQDRQRRATKGASRIRASTNGHARAQSPRPIWCLRVPIRPCRSCTYGSRRGRILYTTIYRPARAWCCICTSICSFDAVPCWGVIAGHEVLRGIDDGGSTAKDSGETETQVPDSQNGTRLDWTVFTGTVGGHRGYKKTESAQWSTVGRSAPSRSNRGQAITMALCKPGRLTLLIAQHESAWSQNCCALADDEGTGLLRVCAGICGSRRRDL